MANEKRLIDADELVDGIEKRYCKPCEEKHEDYNHIRCRACWVDDMVGELESAPTVDAVEVVRCKDCKHRKEKTCANPCYGMWVGVELKDDDFCSYGERREGE